MTSTRTASPRLVDDEVGRARMVATAHEGVRALLTLAGYDPDSEGLTSTPRRVVDALMDMTSAPGEPAALLQVQFGDLGVDVDEMIHLGPVAFASMCEHHLLPFVGTVHLAYIPGAGRVVGLSKLARLVEHYALQLQVQERLTGQLADALVAHLEPRGAAVLVRATHTCMSVRGIRKPGALMTTSALRGVIKTDAAARGEFLALAHATPST